MFNPNKPFGRIAVDTDRIEQEKATIESILARLEANLTADPLIKADPVHLIPPRKASVGSDECIPFSAVDVLGALEAACVSHLIECLESSVAIHEIINE